MEHNVWPDNVSWTGVDYAFPYTSGSEALYVMDDLGTRAILTAAGVVQCAPVTTRLIAPSAE